MKRIVLLPIESLEERYTAQWARWWPNELRALGWTVEEIQGDPVGPAVVAGQFLDVCSTWVWKGSQVAALARAFIAKAFRPGDVILSLDGWGPGVLAAAYMRDGLGIDVKIVSFLHAGTYDVWDFLAQRRMGRWARGFEESIAAACDLVLVGSEFHKALLVAERDVVPSRIAVTGVPVHASAQPERIPWEKRERLVVFPHRLAPEKAPEDFATIQRLYETRFGRDAEWVRTKDVWTDKAAYYDLLNRARVVVSTARQETFGIAMQEGIAAGAWAVAPRRLAYPEVIRTGGSLYDSLDQAADFVHGFLKAVWSPPWDGWHEGAINRASAAIEALL